MVGQNSPRRTRSKARAGADVEKAKKAPLSENDTPPPTMSTGERSEKHIIDLTGSSPPALKFPTAVAEPWPPVEILLPAHLTTKYPGPDKKTNALLIKKQNLLKSHPPENIPSDFQQHVRATVDATLIFAQSEAGTAVCISPKGFLLTCAHCVYSPEDDESEEQGPDDDEAKNSNAGTDAEALIVAQQKQPWLLFASGRAVRTSTVALDLKRDLALLRITAAQSQPFPSLSGFPFATMYDRHLSSSGRVPLPVPTVRSELICVGQPADQDLEALRPGIKTGYDVLHVSEGKYRGMCQGQDEEDNSEIGALMHDCWTYWGHSGAPLFNRKDGRLVGLHSSWDDETGMRRGVGGKALMTFLGEHKGLWQ